MSTCWVLLLALLGTLAAVITWYIWKLESAWFTDCKRFASTRLTLTGATPAAFAQHAAMAYKLSCFPPDANSPADWLPSGYVLLGAFPDNSGYAIADNSRAVISLRGTFSIKDVWHDLEQSLVPARFMPGKAHKGSLEHYTKLRPHIFRAAAQTSGPLHLTGHSSGAVVAAYAAADLARRHGVQVPEQFGEAAGEHVQLGIQVALQRGCRL